MRKKRISASFGVLLLAFAWRAEAQVGPARPVELAHGTLSVAGDVSASVGARDEIAYFNYTDYEHNALRMIRVALSAVWHPSDQFAVLTQVRTENLERPVPYALYVRIRPWKNHAFDVQAGRIPPVFGSFARRSYGSSDNPLIGYPLAYQYLTSLRPDAIPASADDLLLMRARGWRATYPVGSSNAAPGVPLISSYRWDTGVEGHVAVRALDVAVAVTAGTLSNPRLRDDNDGRQVSARVGLTPVTGLIVGASASRGAFLTRALVDRYAALLGDTTYAQKALGVDGEYSRDYWIVRGEWIQSRWNLPALGIPLIRSPLRASSGYVEGRYKFTPRLYAAARADALTFSRISGHRLFDKAPTPWDAPVRRVELGGGVYLQRNLTLRAVVQRNWRDAGRVHNKTFVSGQILYWF